MSTYDKTRAKDSSATRPKVAKSAITPGKVDKSKRVVRKAAEAEPTTVETKQVNIARAKGRPMLSWVGKRPLRAVTTFPAQLVETFTPQGADKSNTADVTIWKDWPEAYPRGGLLFHGDNKEVLAHLLASGLRGKVSLIYIDPPFDSGADYVRKVQLRGPRGNAKLEGETYSLGEQLQYSDIWANDNYLQFMYERLLMMKELLAANGSIYLHCDNRKGHHLRCLLDEVFGSEAIVNEIIWRSTTFTGSSKAIANRYPTDHNTIYWYHKGDAYVFNKVREAYKEEYLARFTNPDQDLRGPWQSVSLKTFSTETFERLKAEKRLISPQRYGAGWRFKFYLSEAKGKAVETLWLNLESTPTAVEARGYVPDAGALIPSIWLDINMANSMADERTGYPTEKPEELLSRVIEASSNPGDLVLDCFLGSGTTAAVAQRLGRRWIGCDINKGAIQTTTERLQLTIAEQLASTRSATQQQNLLPDDTPNPARPAQFGFAVYRVNDYDLAIQLSEAVNLACEHIGVTRTLSDAFFDGTLGGKLVKIVPFGHPLSAADLEDMKRELDARANESRDVLVLCPTNNFTGVRPICYGPVEVEWDGQAECSLDDYSVGAVATALDRAFAQPAAFVGAARTDRAAVGRWRRQQRGRQALRG